jgi:PAS domain S-box-containing protein
MQLKAARLALKVALIYIVVAGCWILFSDRLLALLVADPERKIEFSIFKGWLFVFLTGYLLYQLLNRWLTKWEQEVSHRQRAELDQKKTTEDLRTSEERYQALFDRSLECVFLCDFEGRFLDANQAALDLLGYSRENICQLTFASLLSKDQMALARKVVEEIKREGHQVQPTEFRLRTRDGRVVYVETRGSIINRDGKPFAIQGIAHNVTGRRTVEEALRELTARLTEAQRIAGIGSYTLDTNSGQWTCSVVLDEILGITDPHFKKDVAGWLQIVHPFDRAAARKQLEQVIRQEKDFDLHYRITRQDNQRERWVHGLGKLVRNEAGDIVQMIGTIQDVTEQKQAEAWSSRLATAVEQASEAIVITDATGTILYANPAFEKTSGYTSAEAIGKNPRLLKSGQHGGEFYQQLWETILRGQVWTGHFTNRRKNGTLYDEEATVSPVRDNEGKIVNFVAVKRDVTRERQLEAQFRQAQKMDAIGTLAGGIAHDFNNILTAIFGNCYLLREDLNGNTEAQEKVEEIMRSSTRAKDLVQQILTFSRKGEEKRQVIPLNTVIKEATKFIRATLPSNIKVNMDLAPDAPPVLADPTQIYQVTMNLATNALHAMSDKPGELDITLDTFVPDMGFIQLHPEFQLLPYARLTVADTGCGMDEKTKERIFEPFFTTKPVGQGTGLGLSVVHGVVKSHDGVITVDSLPGKGTTFRLYFPGKIRTETLNEISRANVVCGQGQKVLLVDDEAAIASVFQMLFKLLNYQATVHMDPKTALAQFSENPLHYDIVITDLTMPDLNGLELASRIRSLRPDIPIIMLTGLSSKLTEAEIAEAGVCELMEKPVSMAALAETLQRNLP